MPVTSDGPEGFSFEAGVDEAEVSCGAFSCGAGCSFFWFGDEASWGRLHASGAIAAIRARKMAGKIRNDVDKGGQPAEAEGSVIRGLSFFDFEGDGVDPPGIVGMIGHRQVGRFGAKFVAGSKQRRDVCLMAGMRRDRPR